MKENNMNKGRKAVAVRMQSAMLNFDATIANISGCSIEVARNVTALYLKLKVAKMDAVHGVISVKHGAYLDKTTIENAISQL